MTNPMTTADAKVELAARAIGEVLAARHGGHSDAWMTDEIYEEARAAITALEASHSMTEAITPEMIEAGRVAYFHFRHTIETDVLFCDLTVEEQESLAQRIYLAMQAARPIDRKSVGVPASPSGCQPSASAAEEASSQSGIPNAKEFVPPPTADELPIVQKLERGSDALGIGDIWLAAGIIKGLYSALSEAVPEVAALAHCCHTLDQEEMWAVVHRGDNALAAARQ